MHLNNRDVSVGRQNHWITFLSARPMIGQFYDNPTDPMPRRKPVLTFSTPSLEKHNVTVYRAAPASGRVRGWPMDATIRRIAGNYSPSMQKVYRSPTLAIATNNRWSALWEVDGELWSAESLDEGATWTEARLLPVPINSAHREWRPILTRLGDGRYVLAFNSDRGIPRRARSYLSVSGDFQR